MQSNQRLDKFRQKMSESGLEAWLVTDPLNRRYLSGFSGSAGMLLITQQVSQIIVDFRYFERAARESTDWEQVRIQNRELETLGEAVQALGIRQLGFESDHVTVALRDEMQAAVGDVSLVPQARFILPMRAIKDDVEIAALRAAVACSDAAFEHLCGVIRPGMTENEVAWELESFMRQHGAAALSFSSIVGGGPNGAMPHATCSDRPICAGEPIVMDFGALVDGYCSDITRTVCLGQPDDRYLEIWNLVHRAQQVAEEGIRPGMTGQQADALAREVLDAAGYGEHFGHGLGHGVGLNIHESPRLGRLADKDVLESGMVFSIEPGLYLPGWGGVRIEDMGVLRADGVEVLTRAPKVAVI